MVAGDSRVHAGLGSGSGRMPSAVPERGPLGAGDLVALLGPTLGHEKSREAILGAARELGIAGEDFAWGEGIAVLDRLSKGVGILAMAARFARVRVAAEDAPPSSRASRHRERREAAAEPEAPPYEPAPGSGPRVPRARLVGQLAPALGQEKSELLVGDALRAMGIAGDELTLAQALSTLDRLGTTPGLIGVTARFVRARLPMALRRAG